ncbi:hypothetical protein N480_00690 [Pseudoalteromonas luteoviolacea S2607]|uniref:hypothetical protein n=1 Tax=Pseudoalteromonas luteoviolacea TaxID=43657 RepID=UPI0007B173DE|nr:hypothetical protein [Pseudoalteromonas luteoviolacea]KZN39379.1 hypothetical protein N480_00690 [Pseudoalteromonas luteoviolacea S2607]
MPEKYEWRQKEKELYIPKRKPVIIDVTEFSFITVRSTGSPANPITRSNTV